MTPPATPGRTRVVAGLAALLALLDLVSLGALHVLRADVDPVTGPVGDYTLGGWGWLTLTATLGQALAASALVGLFQRDLPTATALRVGLRLLTVCAAAKAVQAFFQLDGAREPGTSTVLVQGIVGNLAFFALPVAAVLISLAWAKAGRPLGLLLRTVAVALAVSTVAVLAIDGAVGVTQRISVVLASLWLLTAGVAVLRRRARPVPADMI